MFIRTGFSLFILLFALTQSKAQQFEINFPEKEKNELDGLGNYSDVDLTGLWEGEISQLNWLGQPEFSRVKGKLHVEIEQSGDKVKGLLVCRAKFANKQGYLSYDKHFAGEWKNGQLIYTDTKVENYINTHRTMRHLETCLKKAELDFYETQDADHLEGSWTGVGHLSEVACVPGKIHLTKIKEQQLVVEEAQTVNINFAQLDKRPVDIKWNRKNKIKKVRSRKVKDGKTITIDSTRLSITVYDHKRDDGDIVSLNYNGTWILEKFEIDNSKHIVDVFLESGKDASNYLLLYAHNLGEYPPNTVAIIVDDGKRKQRFILNADMNQSDVIYFKQQKK